MFHLCLATMYAHSLERCSSWPSWRGGRLSHFDNLHYIGVSDDWSSKNTISTYVFSYWNFSTWLRSCREILYRSTWLVPHQKPTEIVEDDSAIGEMCTDVFGPGWGKFALRTFQQDRVMLKLSSATKRTQKTPNIGKPVSFISVFKTQM